MNKVIQDGKVAVILCGSYGTPWYNDHFEEDLVFDPHIVDLILEMRAGKMPEEHFLDYLETYLTDMGMDHVRMGHFRTDLEVEWVPVGSRFIIHEYDGYEYIVFERELNWFNA